MKIRQFIIDAFASEPFAGNPAAVCLMESWLDDSLMQKIAAENNLAETAFVVGKEGNFHIRWFTPTVEVDLCGHATLASAHAILRYTSFSGNEIIFQSRSGELKVMKETGLLILDFPADTLTATHLSPEIIAGVGGNPREVYKGKTDFMLVHNDQSDIEKLKPDFRTIAKADARGLIVTAPGRNHDFVSRFFAPQSGIDEDPVTGSAHTSLIPYWSMRLKKNALTAKQISKRGGELFCKHLGDRVHIGGHAITFSEGYIFIPD